MDYLDELKHHIETTPKEKLLEEWEKSIEYDKVGPAVDDFVSESKKRILVIGMSVGISSLIQSKFPQHEIITVAEGVYKSDDFFEKHIQKPIPYTIRQLEPLPELGILDIDEMHHAPRQIVYNKALNNHRNNKRRW